MQSFSDELDIRLFSHLIQTVLCCRLSKISNINSRIAHTISKLQSERQDDMLNLNFGVQTISKLHEGSDFKVNSMLKKHFLSHQKNNWCIYLQIFTLHNKKQQQLFSGKSDKNKLIEKWIFRKQTSKQIQQSIAQYNENQTDLILKVLTFIKAKNHSQNQKIINNTEFIDNTTDNKGYQLVIKSKCPKKNKNIIHVLHLEKCISQVSVHTTSLKSSILELPYFWLKYYQYQLGSTFFIGCYFEKLNKKGENLKIQQIDIHIPQQPDRKMSSETKAQQKQKDSTSSFRFSLENFSFRLSGQKALKQSSADHLIRKSSQQIARLHRPRYQSIYESKDEEMNIFILSPRKLSEEQSPKIKHLQQKTISFQITDQRGISEQVIEEFILEPDECMSNGSSEGFQMLQQNDQLDSIRQQKSQRVLKQEQQEKVKNKQLLNKLNNIENQFIQHLKMLEQILISF